MRTNNLHLFQSVVHHDAIGGRRLHRVRTVCTVKASKLTHAGRKELVPGVTKSRSHGRGLPIAVSLANNVVVEGKRRASSKTNLVGVPASLLALLCAACKMFSPQMAGSVHGRYFIDLYLASFGIELPHPSPQK